MSDSRLIPLFMVENTGLMTKLHDRISSPVYRRVSTGERFHIGFHEHPDFPRMPDGAAWFDKDGKLYIRTPGGDWNVDGNSTRSQRPWARHGIPPVISVTPSISFYAGTPDEELEDHGVRRYHAMCENGVLRELDDTFLPYLAILERAVPPR